VRSLSLTDVGGEVDTGDASERMTMKPRKPLPTGRYQPPGSRRPPPPGAPRRGYGAPPAPAHGKIKQIRRPLTTDVLRKLETDPAFQVMTGDQQWIDPFSGQAVPATQGRLESARAFLQETGVWRDREPLPRVQLEVIRWRFDLMRLLPVEPRLRIFGRDGRWLNPFNGELVADIVREEGKITSHTITAMARVLSTCEEAAGGRLLDSMTLSSRIQSLGIAGRSDSQAGGTLSVDMAKARNVQQNMLVDLPAIEGFELAVHFSPQAGVSGDFYEVITLKNGHVMFVIGDVSGHGMQAALVVATALKTLRFLARTTSNMGNLLIQFNDEIRPDLLPGQFITLFAAELDPVTGSLSCIRAGHHAALLVRLDGDTVLSKVGSQGMAIGLAAGPIFAGSMHTELIHLQPGDVLVQYTDGLTEAMNPQSEEYGEVRLYGAIFAHIDDPLQKMVDEIAQELGRFVNGPLEDDLTIFALAMLPGPEEGSSGEWDQLDPKA
jgi:serine phosphatase RsbU (regulator of sigma subunit)